MTRHFRRQQRGANRPSLVALFLPLCLFFFASSFSIFSIVVAAAIPTEQQQQQQQGAVLPTPPTYSYLPENVEENTQTRKSILSRSRSVRAPQSPPDSSLCNALQTAEEAAEGQVDHAEEGELFVKGDETLIELQRNTAAASYGDGEESVSLPSNGGAKELRPSLTNKSSNFLQHAEGSISAIEALPFPPAATSGVHTPDIDSLAPAPAIHRQLQGFDPSQLGPAAQYAQYLTTFLPGQQQQQQLQQLQQLLAASGRGGLTPAAVKQLQRLQRRAQAAAYANSVTSHPLLQGLLRTALTTVTETLQSVSLADVVQSAVPLPPPLAR